MSPPARGLRRRWWLRCWRRDVCRSCQDRGPWGREAAPRRRWTPTSSACCSRCSCPARRGWRAGPGPSDLPSPCRGWSESSQSGGKDSERRAWRREARSGPGRGAARSLRTWRGVPSGAACERWPTRSGRWTSAASAGELSPSGRHQGRRWDPGRAPATHTVTAGLPTAGIATIVIEMRLKLAIKTSLEPFKPGPSLRLFSDNNFDAFSIWHILF